MTRNINSLQLDELLAAGKPVIVDFFATWCAPCKVMAPVVDALSETLGEKAEVVKMDMEENFEAAAKYKVRAVPTFLVIKGGEVVAQKSGAIPRQQFIDWASSHV